MIVDEEEEHEKGVKGGEKWWVGLIKKMSRLNFTPKSEKNKIIFYINFVVMKI